MKHLIGMEMREGGVEHAIRAAGGVGALARALGISQPSVSSWRKIPAERVLAVESLTGVHRTALRPDLYPMTQDGGAGGAHADEPDASPEVDEIDLLRAHEYGLLAVLLGRAPGEDLLRTVAGLKGDATPLGLAHIALAQAAAEADPAAVSREYFDLFVGVVQGELVPYGSYYLTGFLHERPLVRVREDLNRLGVERVEDLKEPEDHVAILCDVMAGLASRRFEAEEGFERAFFERHLKPWAPRFFADLETAQLGSFYRTVGQVGRIFMEIEAEAFAIEA